jgi:hypothetical protein
VRGLVSSSLAAAENSGKGRIARLEGFPLSLSKIRRKNAKQLLRVPHHNRELVDAVKPQQFARDANESEGVAV